MFAFGAAEDFALDLAALAFIVMCTLLFSLVVAVLFRKHLFRWLRLQGEAGLENVVTHSTKAIAASAKGDVDDAAEHSSKVISSGLGWYVWASFYRWVIGSAIAILMVFGAFVGSVLLLEQNKKLEAQTQQLVAQNQQFTIQNNKLEAQTQQLVSQNQQFALQNELMGLSMVSTFRERLAEELQITGVDPENDFNVLVSNRCRYKSLRTTTFHRAPNRSAVSALIALAKNPQIGQRVQDAMIFLLSDRNSSVRLGALLVLDALDAVPKDTRIGLTKMHVRGLFLRSDVTIYFNFSRARDISCLRCRVVFQNSYIEKMGVENHEIRDSIIVVRDRREFEPKEPNVKDSVILLEFDMMPNARALHKVYSKSENVLFGYYFEETIAKPNFDSGPTAKSYRVPLKREYVSKICREFDVGINFNLFLREWISHPVICPNHRNCHDSFFSSATFKSALV